MLAAYRDQISGALREHLTRLRPPAEDADARTQSLLDGFYGQMEYHFGWRDAALAPAESNPGKLLRPALVLFSARLFAAPDSDAKCEAVIARAMPAAVAIEMVHNFSLIHDDIEDGDELRRHRATLWRVWGQPQAINTGDGLFALARASLLDLVKHDVPAATVTRVAALLDRTCLRLCEGQHLDMSFEGRRDVTAAMYLAMIERKTAALMECATEMGAIIGKAIGGASEPEAQQMAAFGRALGMGFQLRDDLLGIWASDEQLGKRAAGDLRRRKMSLPVIYALEHAAPADRQTLVDLYQQDAVFDGSLDGSLDDAQVETALAILERVGARVHVRQILEERCQMAREALQSTPTDSPQANPQANDARAALTTLVDFVAADTL